MTTVRFKLDPNNPPTLTPEQRARLDAMTPQEIEQNAVDDPDNPPLTDEELARGRAARFIRQARENTGLSQAKFAERYRINKRRLQDLEQGRAMPDSAFLAYIAVIRRDPALVENAIREAGPALVDAMDAA
jgi:putative transcriptional regulator